MIHGGEHAFLSERQLPGFVVLDQVEGQTAKRGQVLRGVAGARAGLVFPKGDIQRLMQFVLHAPAPSDSARKGLSARRKARQIIASLNAAVSPDGPLGFNHADAGQSLP